MEFISRFLKPGKEHYFLFGPRGTGKTSWCSAHYKDALRIDLLNAATLRQYTANPESLQEVVEAHPNKRQVIVDEIQKLPALLDMVHLLIEKKLGRQFILTGSSARKLRRQGVNLLGGRAIQKHLHPYMASELGNRFDLATALKQGMLPIVWAAEDPLETLEGYSALYLREEVQMEGFARNIGDFARFLQAISFSHGSVLNLANVARESQVSRKTVEGYLEVLKDLLLGFTLDVFSRRAKRELARHPKFYYFDAGVFRANRPTGYIDSASEIEGLALEGLIAQHLRAWCDYSSGKHQLYYWQTRSQLEIDFIVYGESGFYAIEVKNSRTVGPNDLKGLKHFAQDYPQAQCLLVYRGIQRMLRDGILCVPAEEFLLQLAPDRWVGLEASLN